jgi:hypothetical protein
MPAPRLFRVPPAALAAAVLVVSAPLAVLAADPAKEVSVAAQHAGFAAAATVITTVHAHLHHTVNCLVGPKGDGFDATQLNPCSGFGDGAIPDASDPTKKQALEQALAKAKAGLATNDMAAAKADAVAAQTLLKGAM